MIAPFTQDDVTHLPDMRMSAVPRASIGGHDRIGAVLLRCIFFVIIGLGGTMLILDHLAVQRSRRFPGTSPPPGTLAWPVVHLFGSLYLTTLSPRIRLIRTRGVLAGVRAQGVRILGGVVVAAAYIASVIVSVRSLGG